MVIRINCPACKVVNTVAEDKRGKKVRCRKCEKLMVVPAGNNGVKKKSEESAVQAGRKLKVASARKRQEDAEDEKDDDDNRSAKKQKKAPAKGGSGMMLAVGGVAAVLLLCLLGGGGIGAFFMFRSKPADADQNHLARAADKKIEEKKENPAEPKKDPIVNKDIAEKKDPPAEPKKDPIVDPNAGKPLPGQLAPELVAKVKQATVYLHVTMPSGVTAEGSGFYAMERGIIVTNAHVLGMMLGSSRVPKQVDVVQDSGLPTETRMVGEVLGVDRISDLAVIRVPDTGKLPAPLALASEAPIELQKVYIFGFPFGERLGKNITITEKKVTSLRPDKEGGLKEIQIDGGMNPGNSGGPVVNTHGNLVGVSVSIITGAQISFAVPAERVRKVMEGRVAEHQHGEAYAQQGKTHMPVRLKCLDPLNKIREMRVDVWTAPAGAARPTTDQKPQSLPGDGPRQEHVMKYANGVGTLDVPLPQLPGGHVYWVQPVTISAKGTHWGHAVQTPAEFAVLERKPANLTIDLEKQKERTTKLESRLTVMLTTNGKTDLNQVVQVNAETLEVLQEPVLKDGKKTATVRTAYGPVVFSVNVNGKNIKFDRDDLDAMAIVRGMPPTFTIDDTNGIVGFTTVFLTPKSPKYYLKDAVQGLNNFVQNPYEATQIKMPNRVVQPMEVFPAQSTMARRSRPQQQPAPPPVKGKGPPKVAPPPSGPVTNIVDLKMNLTYQGVCMRNGREEAILTVVGTLESRKIKGRSLGDITGKIGFDIAGGFVSSAKLKIFAESEETIPGLGTFRDSESTDINLDRAAGNLKNLALRENPPPKKDPLPGTGSAGGATKILGGGGDPAFKDDAPEGSLLVGFEVGLGTVFGKNDMIKAVRPIYRNAKGEEKIGNSYGKDFKRVDSAKAKPGYAVGAIEVSAGLWLDGISVTFMKINGAKLDPKDSYSSNQFGTKSKRTTILGGDGTPVVGIVGKANQNDCTGIGLVLKEANPGGPVGVAGGALANPAPNQFFNGDVTLRHLAFTKPGLIVDDIVWAKDAKAFFMLYDNGLLQRVNLASGQTEQFLDIGAKCTALALSGEGLLVAVNGASQLWVVDPDKLANIKKKIPVPGISRVSAGVDASIAWAGFPNPSGRGIALKAVDAAQGTVLKMHAKFEIWVFAASPDGKYVCVASDDGLSRYRVEKDDLIREDVSYRIGGNNTRRICFSPDSRFVAMPSGGGNGVNLKDHPPLKNYSTYIYPIGNLKVPATGFTGGAFPRAVGIDPKSNFILAQNQGKPLMLYSFATDAKIAEYDFKPLQRTTTTEFAVSPLGSEAIARTENHGIVHIKINKAGPPVKIGLDTKTERRDGSLATEMLRGPLLGMPGFCLSPQVGPIAAARVMRLSATAASPPE